MMLRQIDINVDFEYHPKTLDEAINYLEEEQVHE
jgi:hypothetical protein